MAGINREIAACDRCPRLVKYCQEVATVKKREYRDEEYWGRPLPGFGDPQARLLIVGLAPAAHGGNRTGRMFTGDSSADWLIRAMHRAGFASQPTSRRRDDGLLLHDAYITAAARCAPPQNKLAREEIGNCLPFLSRELDALPNLRVVMALGKIAFDTFKLALRNKAQASEGWGNSRTLTGWQFAHGAFYTLETPETPETPETRPLVVVASYHPSRQNTNTGKLTELMFDDVFAKIRQVLDSV
ncbi:MAG: uracil-DNA glycosylase [Firmicutes bacterium]|nr:uracil-DNA glycosylase [Bacillota bacterium]